MEHPEDQMRAPQPNGPNQARDPLLLRMKKWATRATALGMMLVFVIGFVVSEHSFDIAPPGIDETFESFLWRWIGMGLMIGAITTGIFRLFVTIWADELQGEMNTFIKEEVVGDLSSIQNRLEAQTAELRKAAEDVRHVREASVVLDTMQRSGISRLYASREEASEDLARDLQDQDISLIRIASVSLNDFIRGDRRYLGRPWHVVERYVRGEVQLRSSASEPANPNVLDIKVLIVHPACFGAQLRSKGEAREQPAMVGRLARDVDQMATYLQDIKNTYLPDLKALEELTDLRDRAARVDLGRESDPRVKRVQFDVHLYSLPLILSLFCTDKISYVHPFYFWASRDISAPMPMVSCRDSSQPDVISLHCGMHDHFNWIWDNASIPIADYVEGGRIGLDKGLSQAGAINVFTNPEDSTKRILWLLQHTRERLYIQGVALRAFFTRRGPFYQAVRKLIADGNVEIKVLMLRPDSEQAKHWAFSSYIIENASAKFEHFGDSYKNTPMHHDIEEAMKEINSIPVKNPEKFKAKQYDCAPSCFMMLSDNTVLIEQYQYGRTVPEDHQGDGPPMRWGKDLPLVEYKRTPDGLFEPIDPLRNPYDLLERHFCFAFDHCSRPLVDPGEDRRSAPAVSPDEIGQRVERDARVPNDRLHAVHDPIEPCQVLRSATPYHPDVL